MIPTNDLSAIALGRLAHQYRESPNLIAVIEMAVSRLVVVRDAMLGLEYLRRIVDSEGDGLDGIGQILGQPRELAGIIAIAFFDLHDGVGGPAAEGFGDTGNPVTGLRFRSVNESPTANKDLGDAEYRSLLKAKILRNGTAATPEDIISSIKAVLVDDPLVALTFGVTAVTATVQRVLSAEEIGILNAQFGIRGQIPVIPHAVGVELTIVGL